MVAGAHRLAAAKKLGWESIDTVELPGGDLEAQLAEIDENLCRSELTPTEEAEHIGRRKEVWEAMQAAAKDGGGLLDSTGGSTCATGGRNADGTFGEGQEGFASATASATGKSKASTNRAARRYTEVCQAARDLIKRTKLDTGSYLDNLAKRGMVAAKLEQFTHGGDRKSDQDANLHVDRARAAEMLNVSPRTVAAAAKVKDDGAPELVAAVESGKVSVSAAATLSEAPKERQAEIVAKGQHGQQGV